MSKTNSTYDIFVIHALKGYEFHEERIKELFRQYHLDFEFITEGDPSLTNKEIINSFFVSDIDKIMSTGVLSCTLNHIYAYKNIIERGLDYAIIFENDPFFLGDFSKNIAIIEQELQHIPSGYIISLENSTLRFPSYFQTQNNQILYKAKSGRMAGAYLIDYVGAKNIIEHLESHKCNNVIDLWHNTLIEHNIITMYWAHPPFVEQGSHNGLMHSTISSKPRSIFRRISWLAQKLYKYYFRRLFAEDDIM
jgi:glycosyl transferase family 25